MAAECDVHSRVITNPQIVEFFHDITRRYPILFHCSFPESWPKMLLKSFPPNSLVYETFTEARFTHPEQKPDGSLRAQTATIYHLVPLEDDFYIRPVMAVETEFRANPTTGVIEAIDTGKIFHDMVISHHTAYVSMLHFKNFFESVCDHLMQGGLLDVVKFDTRKQCVTFLKVEEQD